MEPAVRRRVSDGYQPPPTFLLLIIVPEQGEMDLMRSCADGHELRVSLVNNGFLMAILTF